MAVSYPLPLPDTIGIASVTLRTRNAVSLTESPFSFKQQIIRHAGQRWEAEVSLPPVRRDLMAEWVATLVSLRGQFGTFLLNDPDYDEPRGTVSSCSVTGSTGDETVSVAMTGSLLAGDYIQLGSGSSARLHKVLADQSGSGSLEIWPALRTDQSGGSATTSSPKGVFRLATPMTEWNVNDSSVYGIGFQAVEVL